MTKVNVKKVYGAKNVLTLEDLKIQQNPPIDYITEAFREGVELAIATTKAKGNPVARYDIKSKRAYLEYPDGRREY